MQAPYSILIELFGNSLWPGLVLWVGLYISDYFLTIRCARLYRKGIHEKICFEGSFELTPYYQKDIDSLRTFSPRFIRALLLTIFTLSLIWWLSMLVRLPELYRFALGALVLVEVVVHGRHLRNLFLFRSIIKTGGLNGRIEYSRPLMLRVSSFEFLTFAALFAILFLVTWQGFVLGGAAACLSVAMKHRKLAEKHLSSSPAA